jgi:hypothetical protein
MLLPPDRTVRDIIHEKSAGADLVFLGLRVPDEPGQRLEHARRLLEMAEPLRSVFFVKNSSAFIGQLVQMTDELAENPEGAAEGRGAEVSLSR